MVFTLLYSIYLSIYGFDYKTIIFLGVYACLFFLYNYSCLIAIALLYSLKSGSVMAQYFFFFQVDSLFWSLLWFYANFTIICFISFKNAIGYFIW